VCECAYAYASFNLCQGTPRRKKKVINKSGQTDEKKLQGTLKKFGANPISSVEEVNMFRSDDKVINFLNPKGKYS
jgi:nascent polypeptide-associated complex subunit beta